MGTAEMILAGTGIKKAYDRKYGTGRTMQSMKHLPISYSYRLPIEPMNAHTVPAG